MAQQHTKLGYLFVPSKGPRLTVISNIIDSSWDHCTLLGMEPEMELGIFVKAGDEYNPMTGKLIRYLKYPNGRIQLDTCCVPHNVSILYDDLGDMTPEKLQKVMKRINDVTSNLR